MRSLLFGLFVLIMKKPVEFLCTMWYHISMSNIYKEKTK